MAPKLPLKTRWLEALKAVVVSGTVTGAAVQLKVTQPAVSRMLTELEAHLAIKLFDRRGGRLTLTPEGHSVWLEAERVLLALDEFAQATRAIPHYKGAKLRIATMTPFTVAVIPESLSLLRREYPDVPVSIDIVGRADINQWMNAHLFDVGLFLLPIEHPAVVCATLITGPAMCVLPPNHPLAERRRVPWRSLLREPLITLHPNSVIRYQIDGAFAEMGQAPRTVVETSSMQSAIHLAAWGVGLTIVDPLTACGLTERVTLRELQPRLEIAYGHVSPTNLRDSRLVARFREIAADVIRKHVTQMSSSRRIRRSSNQPNSRRRAP